MSNELLFDGDGGGCVGVAPADHPPCSRVGKLARLASSDRAAPLLRGRDCLVLVGDKPVDARMESGLVAARAARPRGAQGAAEEEEEEEEEEVGAPPPAAVVRFGYLNHRGLGEEALGALRAEHRGAFDVLARGDGTEAGFGHVSAFVRTLCL